MTCTTLIQANDLKTLLAENVPVVVLDARFELNDIDAGERSFAREHLVGAHYAHLERDLSGSKADADGRFLGRHPLPLKPMFAATVASWGITPATQVVVVDEQAAMFAARAWWMLRWLGHAAVAVLDGGQAACREAGLPMTTDASRKVVGVAPYPARSTLVGQVDAATLLRQLGQLRILDARAGERFRGEVEPLDQRAGHIPGSRNRPFKANLDAAGRFKSAGALHSEYLALLGSSLPTQVVHQCGSGVTACHNLLAMEIAGLGGGLLYPGSWSEWCADVSRPRAQC